MPYSRLNLIVRVFLVGSAALTLLFFVTAARPTPRFRGTILGRTGQAMPLYNDEDQVVMTVRLDQPAVVTFPPAWQKGDEFCGVYTFTRGVGRTRRTFAEELAQSLWDQRGDTDLVIGFYNGLVARTPENYPITPGDRAILDPIREKLGYAVVWFDETESIYLPNNQSASRLLCYHFLAPDGSPRLPDVHVVRFNPRNAQTTQRGGFYLRNGAIVAGDPPEAISLPHLPIAEYLQRVETSGATVVKRVKP